MTADTPTPRLGPPTDASQPAALQDEVLAFRGLTKAFGGTKALDDVSFGIRRGSVHALLGGNGSGKSTLIKILAGVHQADAGEVQVNDQVLSATHTNPAWAATNQLHFVHQNVGVFPDLSVAENFALGSTYGSRTLGQVPWRTLQRRTQEVLDRFALDVKPSTRMGDLRAATQTMVAVARALQHEDEQSLQRSVLVLDEPTASLPADEVELLHAQIRDHAERGQTVILVTHRLDEVLDVATDATFLSDGHHLETRSIAGMDHRALVQRIAGMDHVATPRTSTPRPAQTARLELRNVAAGPLRDVSLSIQAGEVLGVAGLLGSGRSALLRTLFGVHRFRSGTALLDGEPIDFTAPRQAIEAGVAYVPEDRVGEAAFPDQSLRLNFCAADVASYWRRWRMSRAAEAAATRSAIGDYGVVAASGDALLSSLSGGNQQKVVMARWLELQPRLLLLDEPSQGVDVGARAALHRFVRAAADGGAAVLVVSSDGRELMELCDRVIGLNEGQVSGEAHGAQITPQRCLELAYGMHGAAAPSLQETTR